MYNIKYFFLPKVTALLHLMQLRNCVTASLRQTKLNILHFNI